MGLHTDNLKPEVKKRSESIPYSRYSRSRYPALACKLKNDETLPVKLNFRARYAMKRPWISLETDHMLYALIKSRRAQSASHSFALSACLAETAVLLLDVDAREKRSVDN